ncbi:asparaginase [Curvibacter sp. HBC61]|uniref:Asparaginase n=1 Tax=Curvibacter cyanobacteriorum TaxID=3026422 RepID=A0ABT5MV80_9BURK|nr:asparaginase [Curvibacter sp. HBC61]MDD0837940.1 asparaginase [Curvibacter sp. HBC61]
MQVTSPKADRLLVLGTGGTIAGEAGSQHDNVGYRAAQRSVSDLLGSLPVPEGLTVQAEQVAQLDSKDMDHATWQQLLARVHAAQADERVRGIVITHGTDTLEETAFFLHTLLGDSKPVVLTCSMRPATALLSDGPQNLVDALAVAADPSARGVVVVCAGQIHDPVGVQKVHTYRPDAFASGDEGPLGQVLEGRPVWHRRTARPHQAAAPEALAAALAQPVQDWPWVAVLSSHAGATERAIDAWVAQGLSGLVIAGTGNGTVHEALEAALQRAAEAGVLVWRSTRCVGGPVLEGGASPWPIAEGLNAVKARVALLLTLLARRTTA